MKMIIAILMMDVSLFPQPQKLQNNAKAKAMIKDPTEMESIEEAEDAGAGAWACSFSPPLVGEGAAAPLGDTPATLLLLTTICHINHTLSHAMLYILTFE